MLNKAWMLVAVATLSFGGTAWAQCCGSAGAGYGHTAHHGGTNCGREISQVDALALWADYCHETCFDYSRNRQRICSGSCKSGGCFNYGNRGGLVNDGCGTGCGDTGGSGCGGHRHGSHRHGLHRHGGHGGTGCGFRGAQGEGRGRGEGLGGGCFGYPGAGCGCGVNRGCEGRGPGKRIFNHFGHSHGLFGRSAANCGCNGGYFGEAVGPEYGTAGFQSGVVGCGTNFAGSSNQATLGYPTGGNGDVFVAPVGEQ